MERFGFVGLPNAGKSSLYNALAGGGALAAPYAFATVDPNVGVAKVPDDRLQRLAIMSQTKSIVPASVQFVDIAGLVEGAAQGEGLGNRFLAHIREVDAIVFILRAFVDTDVDGSSDPVDQLNTLEVELVYSDLETLEKQSEKRRKAARVDKSLADEVAAMDAALELLQAGTPIYRSDLDESHRQMLKPFFLLTAKPAMALVNLDEEQLADPEPFLAPVRAAFGLGGDESVIGLCIQLEAEAAMLDEESRTEMLEALGLGEGALPTFLHAAYQMLGLRTFFTTGEKETRAWTFRSGSKAPQCAGVIHTDFERGFIRAETIHWDELLELGSWAKAREVGKARIEGKEYVVDDGDVMDFRFNV
ncbi:MAG: redox-regulated ATPase YchF [Microthrixaceae bacterium]